MRRQPLGSGPGPLVGTGYDDLGWNDMSYDVDPDPSGEPAHMVDLKPLLTGSVLAHNVEAEQAVEDSAVEPAAETLVPVDETDRFHAAVPEVVRQQEDLADPVAAVSRAVEPRPQPKTNAPRRQHTPNTPPLPLAPLNQP